MLLVNLYKVHLKKRYTQSEVVKATKLSPVTVNKIFNSTPHDFKFSTIEKLAKFIGCNALDLIIEVPSERTF